MTTLGTPTESSLKTSPSAGTDEAPLVLVQNLGKIFCRDLKRALLYGITDSLRDLTPGYKGRKPGPSGEIRLRKHEFWANQGISFELRRGECLGLIGHNGAGKTTLLKMLNGLIKPDVGSVEIRGRVGALIALGAGFNPILTGRENVYVNGSILGMRKAEIDERFEDILEFADIGKFIDTPVQSYSSGMKVRLGFAIASTLQNEILIVDEVLAVGDFSFKQKCLRRIMNFRDNGGTIIFVSHNLNQLQAVCTRGIYLQYGTMLFAGSIEEASNRYFEDIQKLELDKQMKLARMNSSHEDSKVRIVGASVSTLEDPSKEAESNKPAVIRVACESSVEYERVYVRIALMDKEQSYRIGTVSTELNDQYYKLNMGSNTLCVQLKNLPLVAENYAMRIVVRDASQNIPLAQKGFDDQAVFFHVGNPCKDKPNVVNQFGDIVVLETESQTA